MRSNNLVSFPSSSRMLAASASPSIGYSDTGSVTLTPALLEGLRSLAPKQRRAKVPFVLALGVAGVFATLGLDVSTREFALARGGDLAGRFRAAPATPAPSIAAAPLIAVQTATTTPLDNADTSDLRTRVVAAIAPKSASVAAAHLPSVARQPAKRTKLR